MTDLHNHVDIYKVTVLASHTYDFWGRFLLLVLGVPFAARGFRLLRKNRPSAPHAYEQPNYQPTWR
jgi:hypothetical protein